MLLYFWAMAIERRFGHPSRGLGSDVSSFVFPAPSFLEIMKSNLHRFSLPLLIVALMPMSPWASRVTAEAVRVVTTSTVKPPSDAVVIWDGTGTSHLVKEDGSACDWPTEGDQLIVPAQQKLNRGVWTTYHFRDAQIHIEFLQPRNDKHFGNSGLYFHGIGELQIYDAAAKVEIPDRAMGAIYRIHGPLVNAGRGAGVWQTYDVVFIAPRRDAKGRVTTPGKLTAILNGVLVQHDAEIAEPKSKYAPMKYKTSPYTKSVVASIRQNESGPLYLQDHDSKVRFRNFWIRPLDDQSGWFDPEKGLVPAAVDGRDAD